MSKAHFFFGAVLAFAMAGAAQAAPITWQISGQVFIVGSTPPAGVAIGQTAVATVTFDSATPDADSATDWGHFVGAVLSVTLDVSAAGFSESFPPFLAGANSIVVDTQLDRLRINFAGPGGTVDILLDSTAPFGSDALPLTPPPFALVTSNQVFRQQLGQGTNYFAFAITDIRVVPEPAVAWLAGVGFAALSLASRRKAPR